MTLPILPPKSEELVDDQRFPTLNWISFFDNVANGDDGTTFTPTFVGLTEVGGSATKTGRYWRLNRKITYFRMTITPVTNTSAVAGTTYCNNFPLTITNAGVCATISAHTAAVSGITSADKRIYTAAWSAITSPITLVGIVEVN